MKLLKYLANLGYGSRRDVEQMFRRQRVTDADGVRVREDHVVAHHDLRIDGQPLDPPPGSVVVLHKPLGVVCSTTDDRHPVIYTLLPERFAHRTPIMAPVGRLDRETSGLLLLTDDGALNHRLTSPRSHVPKRYRVHLADPLRGDEGERFASGTLTLESEPDALAPARLTVVGERIADLVLEEGRYHQVRRMFAAVGNHVVALERTAVGALELGDQPVGAWRPLRDDERALLTAPPPAAP